LVELGKNVHSSLVWQIDKYYNSFVVRRNGPLIDNAHGQAFCIRRVISYHILLDKHNNDPVRILTFLQQ